MSESELAQAVDVLKQILALLQSVETRLAAITDPKVH